MELVSSDKKLFRLELNCERFLSEKFSYQQHLTPDDDVTGQ